jgi:hypothetical protein
MICQNLQQNQVLLLDKKTIEGYNVGKSDNNYKRCRCLEQGGEMVTQIASPNSAAIEEIAQTLGEVTGKESSAILREIAANPTHDLAIPSPQAMAVLGKLTARHGFKITRQDICKTKRGSSCSVGLLAELVERKMKQ